MEDKFDELLRRVENIEEKLDYTIKHLQSKIVTIRHDLDTLSANHKAETKNLNFMNSIIRHSLNEIERKGKITEDEVKKLKEALVNISNEVDYKDNIIKDYKEEFTKDNFN